MCAACSEYSHERVSVTASFQAPVVALCVSIKAANPTELCSSTTFHSPLLHVFNCLNSLKCNMGLLLFRQYGQNTGLAAR